MRALNLYMTLSLFPSSGLEVCTTIPASPPSTCHYYQVRNTSPCICKARSLQTTFPDPLYWESYGLSSPSPRFPDGKCVSFLSSSITHLSQARCYYGLARDEIWNWEDVVKWVRRPTRPPRHDHLLTCIRSEKQSRAGEVRDDQNRDEFF